MEGGNSNMSSVDQRVVDMRFNNQQFERGVQTSVRSLDRLRAGLNLDGATRSLSNLDRAGKNFSLAGIAAGVEHIASKFTALGVIGFTVMRRLTNSAINAGMNITKALTIDPISSGFKEYEIKMGAIQTILTNTASKGSTLKDVNETLNELNEYADKTIYNFAEMARNIGTFTAAGVDLKTSAISIKGIANLAAGSGSSALQASTAMYQLSQAIAAGSVKLMDWNSVVNAGMGGELFQKALKKTAKEMGVVVDESIPFRESLEKGWITTEVLTKTLSKFASDESLVKAATQVKTFTQLFDTMKESVQSGWAVSWEEIIGDKNESTNVLTAISDAFGSVVGSSSDARNEMLSFWKANGGRTAIIQGIANSLSGLSSILEPIEKGFRDIFPAMTGQRLVDLTKRFRDLTANFKIGEETANNIKNTFKGLFALLDIGKQALFAIGSGLLSVIKYLLPAGASFLSFTGDIGEFIVSINTALKSSNAFNVGIEKIGKVLKPIADGIKIAIKTIIDIFKSFATINTSGLDAFSEKVKARFEPFTKLGDVVGSVFSKLGGVIQKISPAFYKLANAVSGAFGRISSSIINALNNADFNSIFDMVNSGLFAAILLGLKRFISSLTKMTDNAGGFVGQFTGILDGVRGSLEAYQSKIKASILLTIAISIGILAAALVALSTIDSAKLTLSLTAMTAMFVELFGSMAVFEKLMGAAGFVSMGKITLSMIGLSIAILILSSAVTKLSKLDWQGVSKGLASVAGLALILIGSSKLLENVSGGLIRSSLGFIVLGAAMLVLSNAVIKLGGIDLASLAKGLIGVGVLAAELALFMKVTDLSGMGIMKGAGLLLLATAITILAGSVKKFSEIDTGSLIKGLLGVGFVLAQLAIFVNLTGDSKRVISTAIGLTILGASMLIFAKAIGNMGNMSLETIGKGLLSMAGALFIIGSALKIIPGNMILTGTGLVIIASSLVILSKALANMGGMSWEGIAKGLITLAGGLTIIAIAMAFMTTTLSGAAALLIVAGALTIFSTVLKILGSMKLSEIGKSLLALVGIFTVIGIAGLVLAPLTPILLALSAAIVLFGLGCMAVGAGLLAFSAGLTALAVSGAAGAAALVVVVTSIVGLIPMAVKALAEGIIAFIKVIGDGGPIIARAIKDIVLAVIDLLVEVTPVLVDGFYKMLSKILDTLVEYVPKIVDAGIKLVIGFLKGISDNIADVISVAIKIVVNFINGVSSMISEVIQAGIDFMVSFINGLAEGIRKNTNAMIDAIKNLMSAVIDAGLKTLTESIGGFVEIGKNIVDGLINGMKNMIKSVSNSAWDLGNSVLESAKEALGIRSPSKLFKEIGNNIVAGLTNGITDDSKKAVDASANMSKSVVSASNKSAKEAFDASVSWIDDRKYYNKLSLSEELKAWEDIQKRYLQGTEERKKADREVYRVKKELYAQDYKNSIEWIDDKKYYNELNINSELEAWERVQKRYLEGTEERKKADREVYRLKNEIIKLEEDNSKKSFDDSVSWIDDRKYYNKLSLSEELEAWERVQKRYLEGTEERKKADREVYRLKTEISKVDEDSFAKSVNDSYDRRIKLEKDEYEKLQKLQKLQSDTYNEAINFIEEKKYYNQLALGDELALLEELQKEENISGEDKKKIAREVYRVKQEINKTTEEYTKNVLKIEKETTDKRIKLEEEYYNKTKEINNKLKLDIKNVTDEYDRALESRTNSLYSSYGLFDKIGVKESVSGSELITNLKDQIKEFESWQQNINELSSKGIKEELLKELENMGPKSLAQIKALNQLSGPELDEYVSLWQTKYNDAKKQAIGELEGMRLETLSKINDLTSQSVKELDEYRNMWAKQMTELTADSDKQLTTLKTEWNNKIGSLRTDTEKEFEDMTTNIQTIMKKPDWSGLGSSIIGGISKGVKSEAMILAQNVAEAARLSLQAAKDALGIKSPSKEFTKVGMYSVKGFVIGLRNFTGDIVSTSRNIGNSAVAALKSSISNISEVLQSNMDSVPVIRPVIDLSNIESGGQRINELLSQRRGINVTSISKKIPNIGQSNQVENTSQNGTMYKDSPVIFTQNNYSPKALSRLDIYRQTKNQVLAMKGLVRTV
jgi:tape measure domain-containing protein